MRNRTLAVVFTLPLVLFLATAGSASAQQYQPTVGQEGKDVVWVPTPEELVQAMLDLAKVGSTDYVIDLGSGDGRIVIAAAKRGARALGIEYNPDMVELSKGNAAKEGVSDRANFMCADIFETDFSRATVLTLYLLPDLNIKLRPKILDLKPGTRVVSHAFSMGDWEADQTVSIEERTAFLWIVPAKVAGTWTWNTASGGAQLTLRQTYQKVEGELKIDGRGLPLKTVKLEGDEISVTAGGSGPVMWEYAGHANGNSIDGTAKLNGQPGVKWHAERRAAP